jgi:hypothetical protein
MLYSTSSVLLSGYCFGDVVCRLWLQCLSCVYPWKCGVVCTLIEESTLGLYVVTGCNFSDTIPRRPEGGSSLVQRAMHLQVWARHPFNLVEFLAHFPAGVEWTSVLVVGWSVQGSFEQPSGIRLMVWGNYLGPSKQPWPHLCRETAQLSAASFFQADVQVDKAVAVRLQVLF